MVPKTSVGVAPRSPSQLERFYPPKSVAGTAPIRVRPSSSRRPSRWRRPFFANGRGHATARTLSVFGCFGRLPDFFTGRSEDQKGRAKREIWGGALAPALLLSRVDGMRQALPLPPSTMTGLNRCSNPLPELFVRWRVAACCATGAGRIAPRSTRCLGGSSPRRA
jgi:hypothetical protein